MIWFSNHKKIYNSLIFLLFFLRKQCIADSEDVLGCGGFIKSSTDIDFSQISVKLYTKAGSLKDQTECAPNTGYYFLPIYDNGKYVLKVESPSGWSFEPNEVSLNVDGSHSDLCSQGKDINFIFKGFGITGRVTALSQSSKNVSGPKGVTVTLYDSNNKTVIDTTTTKQGGAFSFSPVQLGKYVIVVSHPVWTMDKHSTRVTVQEGSTVIKDGLLSVFGFDVSGRVTTTDNEPVGKVSFILFGNGKVKNCITAPVEGFQSKKPPLCHVVSDKSGRFTFPALSSGDYVLIPFYAGVRTKFDVQPSELSFTVGYESLILPQTFKVTGFTVSGNVMASLQPLIPLPGAKVFLSKKQIAVTDQNGAFKTDNVKAKQYTLHAEADDYIFKEQSVKVSPSNPELPGIVPYAFKVSGMISSTVKSSLINRYIKIKKIGSSDMDVKVAINPDNGSWNTFLQPGKYEISVMVSEDEKSKGLHFYPLQHTIDVSYKPVVQLYFMQLKVTLKGTVNCFQDKDLSNECKKSQITLKLLDGDAETKTTYAKDGEYTFEDVLPGQYEVFVDSDTFCWKNSVQKVIVEEKNPPKISPFQQTGFSVTFMSSHDTTVEYSLPNKPNKKMTLQLTKGSTRHCVPDSGKYEFFPKSCHKYSKNMFVWSTNERSPIMVSSNEHLHKGLIKSSVAADGIKIKIEKESEENKPLILGPLKHVREGDIYKYEFTFYAITGEKYSIYPLSESLLFDPPSQKIIGSNDCENNAASFQGQQGKIIHGSILPRLPDVMIKIFGKDKESPVHTLVTQQSGNFKVGPLDGKISYSITAEKEGYVLTRDVNSKEIVFLARKLAEINLQVIDTDGGDPLQGVLISLSGGSGTQSYRKNSITGENGQLTFNSLSPGEYYLRPTIKEYRFEPSSRMIRVEEGATLSVGFVGKRVAFSAYGIVTSLNGQPEGSILVEALGQGDCSELHEEAMTKEDGTWRIRGLEPRCLYAIKLKINEQSSNRVRRAIPSSVAVAATQDIYNIKLIALEPISRTDVTVRIIASQPEFYKTLKVKLYREDVPDSPIQVAKFDNHILSKYGNPGLLHHFPPIQADGAKYYIQLESSLSKSSYKYNIFPIYFEANSTFKFIELKFDAERKQDQADVIQMSFMPLPLIIMITFAFFNRDSLSIWLNSTIESWSRKSFSNSRNSQVNSAIVVPNDPRADDIIVEQIESINRKNKKAKPRKT